MKLIAVILLAQLALSSAFPLDSAPVFAETTNIRTPESLSASASASARVARDAFSKSGSEVGPDGHLKSSSIAAKTGEDFHGRVAGPIGSGGIVPPPTGPVAGPAVDHTPDDGHDHHDNINNNNGHDASGPEPVPAGPVPAGPVPVPEGPVPVGPAPIRPVGHGPTKSFQKVDAVANKDTGTAIATATNKRDTTQVQNIQKAAATGNVAIAKTKNTSQQDGVSFQKSQAQGGKLAVATSENGRVFKRDAIKNVQVVKAQGNKAISTALENKGSALNVQQVGALGGDLAVAKASSGPVSRDVEPVPFVPFPPKKSVQVVKAAGNNAISKAQHASTGPGGESVQHVQSSGGALGVASAVNV